MNRLTKIGLIGALYAVGLINPAFSADLSKEGAYDYTTCFTRTVTQMEYSPNAIRMELQRARHSGQ